MPSYEMIKDELEAYLLPLGFEVHPFLVGWYNQACLSPRFHLTQYSDNTLAFLLVSTPSMFEKCFKPFVSTLSDKPLNDPIDECVAWHVRPLAKKLDCDFIGDQELTSTRRPKMLMQTAGHISGAAYYYKPSGGGTHTNEDPTKSSPPLLNLGLNVHPLYGGWFAFRGALISRAVTHAGLPRRPPVDVIPDVGEREDLIREFNVNWEKWDYRDAIPGIMEKYSKEQIKYFSTKPSDRWQMLFGQ